MASENLDETLVSQVFALVLEVKKNYRAFSEEWRLWQTHCASHQQHVPVTCKNPVVVSESDLGTLAVQTGRLKLGLRHVINHEYIPTVKQLHSVKEKLATIESDLKNMKAERDHWKARCDITVKDLETEKQDHFAAQCELQELRQQLSQQSQYSASMGAAACTLLWRVSRCQDSIQSILVGTKVEEFLALVCSTLDSYIQTYKDEVPQEQTEETQFILALCGIITNIAASPFGRNYLMTHSQGPSLVDTLLMVLSEAPNRVKACAKMKNLVLMSLYNLSINQKGLTYIGSKPGILGLLVWLLQEETEQENRLHTLRLIQSLVYEQNSSEVLHEAKELLTLDRLQTLARDRCVMLREAALELMNDMQLLSTEQ